MSSFRLVFFLPLPLVYVHIFLALVLPAEGLIKQCTLCICRCVRMEVKRTTCAKGLFFFNLPTKNDIWQSERERKAKKGKPENPAHLDNIQSRDLFVQWINKQEYPAQRKRQRGTQYERERERERDWQKKNRSQVLPTEKKKQQQQNKKKKRAKRT